MNDQTTLTTASNESTTPESVTPQVLGYTEMILRSYGFAQKYKIVVSRDSRTPPKLQGNMTVTLDCRSPELAHQIHGLSNDDYQAFRLIERLARFRRAVDCVERFFAERQQGEGGFGTIKLLPILNNLSLYTPHKLSFSAKKSFHCELRVLFHLFEAKSFKKQDTETMIYNFIGCTYRPCKHFQAVVAKWAKNFSVDTSHDISYPGWSVSTSHKSLVTSKGLGIFAPSNIDELWPYILSAGLPVTSVISGGQASRVAEAPDADREHDNVSASMQDSMMSDDSYDMIQREDTEGEIIQASPRVGNA
jgi:hypothetical protein